MDNASLKAALATLLPGDDRFPGADDVGLADRLLALEHLQPAIEAAMTRLPADIAARSADDRRQALRSWEDDDPERFGTFVIAAYSAYYTHPAVLAAVQTATGSAARPPQPEGYALPAFDETIVAAPRRRQKLWRNA